MMKNIKSIIKRTLSVALPLVIIMSVFAGACVSTAAESLIFTENGIIYEKVNFHDTTVKVIGYDKTLGLTEIVVPATVRRFTIDKIEKKAFCCLEGEQPTLKSVIISEGIEQIGRFAFGNNTNLENVSLPDSLWCIDQSAFFGCTKLESIIIPESVRYLRSGAFKYCHALKNISLPSTVQGISSEMFYECFSLETIDISGGCCYVGNSAFYGCVSLREINLGECEDSTICESAFQYCESLTSINIPRGFEHIEKNAFSDCYSLSEVKINSDLESIGERAFFNCYSLLQINVPKSVEKIGPMAFACFEDDGKYYYYTNFTVVGEPSSFADEYAKAYDVKWQLPAPKLKKVQNTADGVKVNFTKHKYVTGGKYRVYRKTEDGSYKKLADVTGSNYTDKTAKSGTEYFYSVKYIGKPANSVYDKDGLSIVRLSNPSVSKIANTNDGAKLTIKAVSGAAKYNVYVKSGSKWKKIGDTTSTSFIHTAAKSGTTYKYTVKAYDSSGDYASAYDSSGFSNKFVASPKISKTSNTTTGIKITWGKVTGAEKYRVFVKSGSKWKKLTDTTSTSYTHTGRESGKTYTYTVRCVSSTGKSYKSGYDKEGTKHLYLATPKVKKISNTIDGAKLTWGKVEGATKYNVYVKSGSKWKKLGDTTSTTFTHTTAKSGTTYTYTVKAYDETGAFASAYKSAGDKNKFIDAPVISELTSTSKGVKIKWGEVKSAVNYRVFVKTDASADWTKLTDTTSTSFTHKKAKSGKTYYYTVRCISSTGKSYVSGYDKIGQSILFEK